MAFRITLGRYVPANSPIHRLDPRAKLLCGFALMISVFFIHTPVQLAFSWVAALLLVMASRIPAIKVLESVKPIIAVLLVPGGTTLLALGPIRITDQGLWAAVNYSLRLVVAVLVAMLILLTTTPTQLTDAFDALLSPLSRLGMPGHEIAMVFSLMLRFIPTIADEASAIIDAQTARGGGLAEGSLAKRVRSVVPVIVALLASSLRHANDLSRALDARCYEGGSARSHWHPLIWSWYDSLAIAITCAYISALILLG